MLGMNNSITFTQKDRDERARAREAEQESLEKENVEDSEDSPEEFDRSSGDAEDQEEVLEEESSEYDQEEYDEESESENAEEEQEEEDLSDESQEEEGDEEIDQLLEKMKGKKIPVKYLDPSGREVEDAVDLSEDLPKIMSIARQGVDALNYAQNIDPVVQKFKNSRILQDVYYYLEKGYSEDDIKRGLPKIWQGSEGEAPEEEEIEFDNIEDKIEYLVQKRIEQMVDPIKQEMNSAKAKTESAAVERNNVEVLQGALENIGVDASELTEAERIAIDNSFSMMYPGISPSKYKLSPAQANIIVKDALTRGGIEKAKKTLGSNSSANSKKNKAKAAARNAKATRTLPGRSVRKKPSSESKPAPRMKVVTEAERIKNAQDLMRRLSGQ